MVDFPTSNVGAITVSVKVGNLSALGGKDNKADWPHWTLGMMMVVFVVYWGDCYGNRNSGVNVSILLTSVVVCLSSSWERGWMLKMILSLWLTAVICNHMVEYRHVHNKDPRRTGLGFSWRSWPMQTPGRISSFIRYNYIGASARKLDIIRRKIPSWPSSQPFIPMSHEPVKCRMWQNFWTVWDL